MRDITYSRRGCVIGAKTNLELVGFLPKLGHCPLVLGDINLIPVHEISDEDLDQSTIQLCSTRPAIEARR